NLDLYLARRICHRPEVSDVAVAADPDRGTVRQRSALQSFDPFVEFDGVAAHVGMGRAAHLEVSRLGEGRAPRLRAHECRVDLLVRHCSTYSPRAGAKRRA